MDIVSQFSRSDGKIYSKELVRYLVDPQTVADDKFKRVFVWFTLTTILRPTASLSLPKKWLVLLKDTSRISSMNWAAYSFLWLMNGIKEFKGDKTYCSGNLLFLQLFYMDCVKSGPTIVDKSLHPVESWGDREANKLLGWVYNQGGLTSESVDVSKTKDRTWRGRGRVASSKVSADKYEELAGKVASLQDGLAEVSGKLQDMMDMMQTLVSAHNKAKEANTEAAGCVAIVPIKQVSPSKAPDPIASVVADQYSPCKSAAPQDGKPEVKRKRRK